MYKRPDSSGGEYSRRQLYQLPDLARGGSQRNLIPRRFFWLGMGKSG